jgi:hypothetical protein
VTIHLCAQHIHWVALHLKSGLVVWLSPCLIKNGVAIYVIVGVLHKPSLAHPSSLNFGIFLMIMTEAIAGDVRPRVHDPLWPHCFYLGLNGWSADYFFKLVSMLVGGPWFQMTSDRIIRSLKVRTDMKCW